jgi:hypothetical protein
VCFLISETSPDNATRDRQKTISRATRPITAHQGEQRIPVPSVSHVAIMEDHSVRTPTLDIGLSNAMASDSDTEFESMNTSFQEFDRWQANIGLKTFGEGLNAAAKAIFPDESSSRYTEVYVLMMCWADEDPAQPLSIEILNLFKVFKDIYNFKVEVFRIPNHDSDIETNEQIRDLVKQGGDSDDHLKIVYYAGESRLTKSRDLLWTR